MIFKFKNKLAALISICLVVAVAFTGCNQGDGLPKLDPKNPVAIEIWHYYNSSQKTAFDKLVNEFNETIGQEKGIVVEAFSQGSVTELTENVVDAANKKVGASDIPDIFAAYADTAYQIDQMGLVASIDQYLTKEELDEYIPGYLEEGRFDEKQTLKIFPTAKSTEILMLNKTDWDKFAAATGTDIKKLETIEGVTETAKKYYEWTNSLTVEKDDGKAFFGRDAVANYMIIGSRQLGVEIFEVANGEVKFNTDKKIIRKLWDNFYVPYINNYFTAIRKFRSDDAKSGDLIALVGSTSGASFFPNKVTINDTNSYDIDVLAIPAPVFESAEKYAVQQGAGLVVTKSEPETEYAATVFLKWFTDAERNINYSIGSGYLPVKKEANNTDEILASLDKGEDTSVTKNLRISLPIAVETVNNYKLYTNKAFSGGTAARAVLETSMINKAKADQEQILKLMDSGSSRTDAVAKFDTDQNFEEWYNSFVKDLQKAVE